MLKFFRKNNPDPLVESLRSEISFLREQIKTLTEKLSPAPKPNPQAAPFLPQTYDEATKKFRPKTPEEINRDLQGLKELGIL